MNRLYSRIRFLHNLNAALTNQRQVDGLVRELQMKLPRFMDYTILEVLVIGAQPELHVFQSRPVDHELVWKLAEDVCTAVSPFTELKLAPESLSFLESPPARRSDDTEPPVAFGEEIAITIPMVFCGELVGGIGVLSGTEITSEHHAILQLIAYQLAASIRNAQALEAAESASMVDELTGAYNRRYLKRALPAEWRRAERYRVALSFAMVDIDHFKRINDIHGHVVGDAVLQSFASLMRQQLRDTDHLIRYGGEEFLLILPETSLRDATLVLERIRLLLARTPVFSSERTGTVQITVSAGVAGFPTCSVGSGDELIHLADEALLAAKRSGRDRVCLASGQGFDTLGLEEDAPSEKRRFSRIRSQLPVRFVELPEFEGRAFSMSATDVSAGGIAVHGPRQPLKKNAYALVYLGDEQKPRLSQVMWTRDAADAGRAAGLQFVGVQTIDAHEPAARRRALVLAQDPSTRAMIERVMSAAQYDIHIVDSATDIKVERLEDYSLLVLGESSLRGELGQQLQTIREQLRPSLRIALINESHDRRAALDTIRAQHADLLVPGTSEDALFATLSKLLLEEYFGLKKYLLWGAETRTWSLDSSIEKAAVLDGIKGMAHGVRCHPRITDLLVSAVDEMIINALYRPEPIDQGTGRSSRPVNVECGSDGRFLGVAVLDEHGLFCHDDLFRGIGKALEHEQKGIAEDATHAHLGFRIMLSTLSHLVINVDPGRCTEIIGLVDLRKTLKEYRSSVPSLGMFTNEHRNK
jgi:diguanylate cyclase (GGDEF)-like protein